MPPVVAAPAFAIHRPAVAVFTLDDYVAAGIIGAGQAEALRVAVADRRNILVAGGTSTGKNHSHQSATPGVKTSDRVVLIEDTRELQYAADLVAMRTKDGVVSLSDMEMRSSLRLRLIAFRSARCARRQALDLLKAWGAGHPGGIGTIHADTAIGALRRLGKLIQSRRHGPARPDRRDDRSCRGPVGRGHLFQLAELARIEGLGPDGDYRVTPASQPLTGDPS
ncbi:MAG: ATPase, T2SS/T4P/T4SS family [Caulobacteraceae bacterium]